MRVDFHVQPESFEYIGFEYDRSEELTDEIIQEALDDYRRAKSQIKGGEGIPEKEMDEVVRLMLLGETVRGGIEIYNRMSTTQQKECQRLKRLKKRINSKIKE